MVVFGIALLPGLYGEAALGVDLDAIKNDNALKPGTLSDLLRLLKPATRPSKYTHRVSLARRTMAAAGISVRVVSSFQPGIEHRRVIWDHVCAFHVDFLMRLHKASVMVTALHTLHAIGLEFRTADGRLMAFSMLVNCGEYVCGPLYAARREASRAGLWTVNLVTCLELLCAGGLLSHARIFDVGPTFFELKGALGLAPLGWVRSLRLAAFGC